MSRIRRPLHCFNFKRRNATRNGYTSVDEGDSDVSMAGAGDLEERSLITYLLDARLHIESVSTRNYKDILKYFKLI